jgi:DNA repair exonuclease SbcCD ATPase subunit
MLILRKLKLVNACQHVELERELKPGIVAIVGPNGSGKTNLMQLVRASVTNTYAAMAGKKADNINRLSAIDEPSYVETTWQVDAGNMLIRRSFRNSDAGLWLNNQRLVGAKNDDITAKAVELAGVAAKVFDDFLFANFTQLTCVANGTKEARVSLIQPLCGLDRLPTVDRYLRDAAVASETLIESFDQSALDSALAKWSQCRFDVKAVVSDAVELTASLPSAGYIQQQRTLLREYQEQRQWQQDLSLAIDRKRKAKAEYVVAADTADESKVAADQAAAELLAAKQAYDACAADKLAADKWKTYLSDQSRLQKILDKPLPVEPDKPADKTAEELSADIEYAKLQLSLVTKARSQAKTGKKFQCGACRNLVEASQAYFEQLEAEYSELKRSIDDLQVRFKVMQGYSRSMLEYRDALRDAQRDKASAKQQLQSLQRPPQASFNEDDAAMAAARLKAAKTAEQAASASDRESSNRLAAAKARYDAAVADVHRRKAEKSHEASKLTAKAAADIEATLAAYDEANQKHTALKLREAGLRGQAGELAASVRKLRAERRKLRSRQQWLLVLKRSRDVLKRDRLPSRVIAVMLRRTTKRLNEYLAKFGVPFSAAADPEQFSFLIRHRDGTREPASRLSTGQSLCLGIAFWLARSDVFAGQLPLFWFDEPVANLDAERKVQVAELFGKLGVELAANGRQGIVITHDEAIIRTATQVIQL